jgi:uncharacterized protein (TIGR03032 family)
VPPELVTERVNQATVMTPWEIDHTLNQILAELYETNADAADRINNGLRSWRHAWRSEWARSGDAPEGWARFSALCAEGDTIAEVAASDAYLPNQVQALEAIRQHIIRPALGGDAALARDRGGVAQSPRIIVSSVAQAPATGVVRIDRPVFVVCSPRAGSSLLFETLARAPGLMTIGGESHTLIESIPELHPSARGWESNRLVVDDATPPVVAELVGAFVAELRDRGGAPPLQGSVRLLEKTPKNSLRVPFLAAAFPDARFVYLYRDPRETVSSMLDAWRSGRFVTYPVLPGWEGDPWSLLLVPAWRELAGRPLGEVVTSQWAIATSVLLNDLEALDPDRWCVASYDRLVADPEAEISRICAFCELEWDVELPGDLPLSRHTLDSPQADKWRRNADELEHSWEAVRDVAVRAHAIFASPPRVKPALHRPSPDSTPAVLPPSSGEEPQTFQSLHTESFRSILTSLGTSLFVSTYQSGRVIVIRADDHALNTHFRGFQVPMGMAARPGELAVGTKTHVERFQNQPALGARLEPPGKHDACFVPRSAHSTGDIRIHDLAYAGEELWAVNTRFSCLCTFDDDYSFVPRWRPPFVSALAAEDRCHLNGLAIVDGVPTYVTALGATDTEGGWRENKTSGGVLMHVPSGEVVVGGLCMPHSPRWHDGRLWLLESGNGAFGTVDLESGRFEEITRVPGFTRGLGFAGPFAFVGLSQVRESIFEGIPLKAEGVDRCCGVWVLDLRTGTTAGFLRFEGNVQELYEVLALPGIRYPEIVESGADLLESSFVLPDAALVDVAQLGPA